MELVIGPDLGISYMAHRGGTVVRIAHTFFFVVFPSYQSFARDSYTALSEIKFLVTADQNGGVLANTIHSNAGIGLQGAREGVH